MYVHIPFPKLLIATVLPYLISFPLSSSSHLIPPSPHLKLLLLNENEKKKKFFFLNLLNHLSMSAEKF